MALTGQQIAIVRHFMKESGYCYTEEWLMACLEWIQENYSRNELTNEFLKKTIHSQWIDTDLTEMESKCLPPNLVDQRCVTLPGLYGLQINAISDVGESSYTQYNKIKKLENENTAVVATDSNEFKASWEPKPRRTLHLTMTDGVQTIFGIEHTTIPRLDLFSKPGTKVVIKGPVECRRGILILKPSHINVIGGEVESLLVKNSVINILSRKLNYEETEELQVETAFAIPPPLINEIQPSQRPTQIIIQSASTLPVPVTVDGFDDDDDIFLDIDENALILAAETQTQMPISQTQVQVDEQSTEIIDDSIIVIDDDVISPIRKKPRNANSQNNVNVPSTSTTTLTNSKTNSVINNYPKQKYSPPAAVLPSNKDSKNGKKKNTNKASIAERKSSFELDDDDDELMELIGIEFEKSEAINLEEISSNANPYRFLKDITMDFHGTIRVKACVTTIICGIRVVDSKMTMKVSINDGTGSLRAIISNEVLEESLGIKATEFYNQKASKDPEIKMGFVNKVQAFQNNLADVNAILELSINPNEDPTIERYFEITYEHIAQLKTRLSRLNV